MLAPSPSQPDRPIHGPWSLLDMLEYKAKAFIVAVRAFSRMELIAGDAANKHGDAKANAKTVKSKKARDQLIKQLRWYRVQCVQLGARMAALAAEETADAVEKGRASWKDIEAGLKHMNKDFGRELGLGKLFVMHPEDADYYENALAKFGEAVVTAFPSTAPEIDEAGKCLAMGRVAATIYHLMRVCEIALRSLAGPLAIGNAQPSWSTIIRKLDKEIKKEPKDRTLSADYAFLEGVSNQMHAVNRAWRTNAMHVDATFSLENARDIFNATKSLMQHLAAGGLCEPVVASPPS